MPLRCQSSTYAYTRGQLFRLQTSHNASSSTLCRKAVNRLVHHVTLLPHTQCSAPELPSVKHAVLPHCCRTVNLYQQRPRRTLISHASSAEGLQRGEDSQLRTRNVLLLPTPLSSCPTAPDNAAAFVVLYAQVPLCDYYVSCCLRPARAAAVYHGSPTATPLRAPVQSPSAPGAGCSHSPPPAAAGPVQSAPPCFHSPPAASAPHCPTSC